MRDGLALCVRAGWCALSSGKARVRVPPCGGAATAGEGEEKEKGKRENYRLAAGRLVFLETRKREEITGVMGSYFLGPNSY